MKKYFLVVFFALMSNGIVSADPSEGEDGEVTCNSGGCTSIIVQDNGVWVCDSDGCRFFPRGNTHLQ